MQYSPYTKFSELPNRVRVAITDARPTAARSFDTWIHEPIPALGHKTVVEVLAENGEGGEFRVIAVCNAIRSKF